MGGVGGVPGAADSGGVSDRGRVRGSGGGSSRGAHSLVSAVLRVQRPPEVSAPHGGARGARAGFGCSGAGLGIHEGRAAALVRRRPGESSPRSRRAAAGTSRNLRAPRAPEAASLEAASPSSAPRGG